MFQMDYVACSYATVGEHLQSTRENWGTRTHEEVLGRAEAQRVRLNRTMG